MALFDRFRRKSYDASDVDDYYDQPKRRNPLVAILLGVVSFLITLALLWLLFIGGRWVYRQVMNDDDKKQTSSSQNQDDQSQSSKLNVENKESGSQSNGDAGDSNTSSTSTNQPRAGTSGGPSTSGNQSGSGSTSQTPATGDDLPRTGDEGM